MNTRLKANIEDAIQKVIEDNCEDDAWENWLHPNLVKQMTDAAEIVFDSAQEAQEYYQHENQ